MFHKTALYGAVMKENIEIVKLLLADEKTDVNILCISTFLIFIKLKYVNINYIQYLLHSKILFKHNVGCHKINQNSGLCLIL